MNLFYVTTFQYAVCCFICLPKLFYRNTSAKTKVQCCVTNNRADATYALDVMVADISSDYEFKKRSIVELNLKPSLMAITLEKLRFDEELWKLNSICYFPLYFKMLPHLLALNWNNYNWNILSINSFDLFAVITLEV